MNARGIDLLAVVSDARACGVSLAEALSDACASVYRAAFPNSSLVTFTHHGTEFLFDSDPRFDRTVLAVGQPVVSAEARNLSYQHGYPLAETFGGRRVDRGHCIPYSSGGAYGPNLYVQDRALNRGWSREGRARKECDTLFASLEERAPDQELVLTARVEAAGVKELDDASAKLLVFLDQSSERAGDKEASISAAQLAISAKRSMSAGRARNSSRCSAGAVAVVHPLPRRIPMVPWESCTYLVLHR